jgi:hypothetical protein
MAEIRSLIHQCSESNRHLRELNTAKIHDILSRSGRIRLTSDDDWHDQFSVKHLHTLLTADHEAMLKRAASTQDGLHPPLFDKLVKDNNTLNNRLRFFTAANTLLHFDYTRLTHEPLFDGFLSVRWLIIIVSSP